MNSATYADLFEETAPVQAPKKTGNILATIQLVIFAVQYILIGGIGAYDTYLSIKHRETLYENELNPIGRWLIERDHGDVALFMGVKMAGTILALGIMCYYFSVRPWRALFVGLVLCVVQVVVLLYLEGFIDA
jgi:hypothetical protein